MAELCNGVVQFSFTSSQSDVQVYVGWNSLNDGGCTGETQAIAVLRAFTGPNVQKPDASATIGQPLPHPIDLLLEVHSNANDIISARVFLRETCPVHVAVDDVGFGSMAVPVLPITVFVLPFLAALVALPALKRRLVRRVKV